MTTATSARPREFTVSEATTSKELYDQLSSLNTGNSSEKSVPIRAYKGNSKGTTRLKIYEKKTETTQKFKAAANPQRVPARILVIKTIEKILAKESANCSSEVEKKGINEALKNINARRPNCNHHDLRIPELMTDLQPLHAIWGKSDSAIKEKIFSPASINESVPPQHNKPIKKSTTPKPSTSQTTKELNTKEKKIPANDKTKNNALIHTPQIPRLKIAQTSFNLSTAISFLESVKKYSHNLSSESRSKASFRIGEIKDSKLLSFYVSTNDSEKIKKNSRRLEERKAENKNITAKRAVTMMRTMANSLVDQKRLTADEVNTVFSPIEKQKFIGLNDVPSLIDLLEKGRRAVSTPAKPVSTEPATTPIATELINFNSNPFDEKPAELSKSTTAPASTPVASTNPFEEIATSENKPSTTSTTVNKTSANPFEDVPTAKNTTNPLPAPPNFFQRMSDFFKPITTFFASVRRFFGFN